SEDSMLRGFCNPGFPGFLREAIPKQSFEMYNSWAAVPPGELPWGVPEGIEVSVSAAFSA
ncbi:MAG: hypothetical protein AAB254_03690, partial [candidate division NC10 bacterium]